MFSRGTASAKKPKVPDLNDSAIADLFALHADENDQEIMTIEGIAALCDSLQIDASSDVRALMLLWKLGSGSKPGAITKEEFVRGMKLLRKDSLEGLESLIPSLDPGFLDQGEFRAFYKFVFLFSREGTHKTIEKEVVCSLLPIVLSVARAPHLPLFLEFLQQSSHQRISFDQWDSFLQFQSSVSLDLAEYDEDGAWPLLLDDYVSWRKTRNSSAKG